MTCRDFAEFLMDYLSGELPAPTRRRFERHLADCGECVAYLRSYQATVKLGKQACTDPQGPVPPEVPEELVRAVLRARELTLRLRVQGDSMKPSTVLRLAGLLIFGAAIALSLIFLPVKDLLTGFLERVRDLGPWGPAALALAYVPACLLFVPGSILTLGAGFAFGVIWGTVAVSVGSVAGVSAAFLVARFFARGLIEERVSGNVRFRAIDLAVGREGFKIVLLTRLSPVFPFNLLNYAFGITRVRFRDHLFASWIGMLPGTVMYVYLGATVKNLADLVGGKVEGGTGQKALFFFGLAATVVVTVLVTRIARKALREAIASAEEGVAHV